MSLGSLTGNRQLKHHFSRGKMPTQRRTTEGKWRAARTEEKEVSHTRVCSVAKRRKKSSVAEVTHRLTKVAAERWVTYLREIFDFPIQISASLSRTLEWSAISPSLACTRQKSRAKEIRAPRDTLPHVSFATAVVVACPLQLYAHASGRDARVRALTPVHEWWCRRGSWNPHLEFCRILNLFPRFTDVYLCNYVIYAILYN